MNPLDDRATRKAVVAELELICAELERSRYIWNRRVLRYDEQIKSARRRDDAWMVEDLLPKQKYAEGHESAASYHSTRVRERITALVRR